MEKTMKARVQHKHDIEANWLKATNFTPLASEIIVYDPDENYDYPRIKIGDGKTNINSLPFVTKDYAKISDIPTKPEDIGALPDSTVIPTVPTKISAFENDSGYLTEHQDISGKLDASALPTAIDTALAQAKASGEFDGKDGKDGVSATHSWNGTILTVTSASGTSSANLKGEKGDTGDKGEQGIQGPAGADGKDGSNGKDGTSVTVKSVSESTADGDSNVVTFSDGKTLTVKNGSKGSKGDKGDTGARGEKGEKGDKGDTGPEGPAGTAAPQESVLYTVQTLTDAQKEQARKNVGAASIEKAIFYIEGNSTTAGAWTGTHDDIVSYFDGLTIAYKINIAGVSDGTTLNINGLGAVAVKRNASTTVTTTYPVGSVVILTYSGGSWLTADYDANSKNTAGTSNKADTKMYMIGATSQTSSGTTTYTNKNVYIGTDNCLYSGGKKVYTEGDLSIIVEGVISALPTWTGGSY